MSLKDRVHQRVVRKMKMPMAMLKGIRAKKISDYKALQERQRVEGVLSVNHTKMPDVDFYLKKQKQERLKHLKSEQMNYKYKGVNSRPNDFVRNLGFKSHKRPDKRSDQKNKNQGGGKKESHGGVVMNFSKKEIDSINKRGR